MICADRFTPVNKVLIPIGELASVEGTPMAFSSPTLIGKRVDDDFEQLAYGHGYDHNWVLKRKKQKKTSNWLQPFTNLLPADIWKSGLPNREYNSTVVTFSTVQ